MQTMSPGEPFGPFTIEGFVAGGGMGQVYAATHSVYGHPAALKVLHERFHDDPRWHRRFSEEGLLGMQLKHPNILSARELLEHKGRLALVMDLVSGGQNLLRVIERDWPTGLSLSHALTIFLRVIAGVEYLHERKIVHGDLKPENVLIDGPLREPASWAPRVTDFGTVSLIADPVQIRGRSAVVASPRYASPEHLAGVDQILDGSDVYALGLILHFLLSGKHASGARTVEEAAEQVKGPVSLVHIVDQPDPLLEIFKRATQPDPNERYESCRALALAIRDVLDELGLGLRLDDLQSELATEVVEERARAQRALHEGGADPKDDSDITLGEPLRGDTSEHTLDVHLDDDASSPSEAAADALPGPAPTLPPRPPLDTPTLDEGAEEPAGAPAADGALPPSDDPAESPDESEEPDEPSASDAIHSGPPAELDGEADEPEPEPRADAPLPATEPTPPTPPDTAPIDEEPFQDGHRPLSSAATITNETENSSLRAATTVPTDNDLAPTSKPVSDAATRPAAQPRVASPDDAKGPPSGLVIAILVGTGAALGLLSVVLLWLLGIWP